MTNARCPQRVEKVAQGSPRRLQSHGDRYRAARAVYAAGFAGGALVAGVESKEKPPPDGGGPGEKKDLGGDQQAINSPRPLLPRLTERNRERSQPLRFGQHEHGPGVRAAQYLAQLGHCVDDLPGRQPALAGELGQ